MSKLCNKCKIIKPFTDFYTHKNNKDGYRYDCKECSVSQAKSYNKLNNKRLSLLRKEWGLKNPEKQKEIDIKHNESRKKRKTYSIYNRNRIKTDLNFRLATNLRKRLSKFIYRKTSVSAVRHLGCSLNEFKQYLESKFQPGMTWENYGQWHIDHIYPLSKLNLNDESNLLMANHYTNLQPLWAADNIRKGNKVNV